MLESIEEDKKRSQLVDVLVLEDDKNLTDEELSAIVWQAAVEEGVSRGYTPTVIEIDFATPLFNGNFRRYTFSVFGVTSNDSAENIPA